MVKISVIVPVYNVEAYLKQCVESILGQTYGNIELILVNDGSTDKSPEICGSFPDQDKRVRVIHKENGGVSSARNAGIKASSGEYVLFADADDWLEADMLEYLLQNAVKSNADISCCAYCGSRVSAGPGGKGSFVKSGCECLEAFLNKGFWGFGYSVWNKLIKRRIAELFDTDLAVGEDAYFLFRALLKSGRIVFGKEAKYHYTVRNGSAIQSFDLKYFDNLKFADKVMNGIREFKPALFGKARQFVFDNYLSALNMILYYGKETEYQDEYGRVLTCLFHIAGNKKETRLPISKIAAYSLFRLNKKFYGLLVKTYYKQKFDINLKA